jgi:hypothetical protein
MFTHFLETVEFWVGRIDVIALLLCLVVFLPLSFNRRTRGLSAVVFVYSSFGWGLYLWLMAFLYTYTNFGLFWLIVGLFFAGIGVVPIAIIGCLIHADWSGLLTALTMLAITFGFRFFGLYVATKHEEDLERSHYADFSIASADTEE